MLSPKNQCLCPIHVSKPYKPLTVLILDCFQRLYDKRPYEKFILNGKLFEKQFLRRPDRTDFDVLIEFMKRRNIKTFELVYADIPHSHSILMLQFTKITSLCLSYVSLSANAMEFLASIASSCVIKSLNLSGNAFTKEHSENLRKFLLNNKTIVNLNVDNCSLTQISFAIIADGLTRRSSIEVVNMGRVVPVTNKHMIDDSKLASVISVLLKQSALKEVNFQHCEIDYHGMIQISECLDNLVYLDLGSNRIGPNGTKILFEILKSCKKLIYLNISKNNIGSFGGEAISTLLPYTNLRYLNISSNGISADSINKILYSMTKIFPFRKFFISENEFDWETVKIMNRQISSGYLEPTAIDVALVQDDENENLRIIKAVNDFDV